MTRACMMRACMTRACITRSRMPRARTTLLGASLAWLLAGCASVPPADGFGAVADLARARAGHTVRIVTSEADTAALAASTRALLAAPLTMEGAVQIALLNNPGLQARYQEVGIARADLAQAARLPNPGLSFERLAGGGGVEVTRSFTFSLVQALTLPLASRVESARFEQVKLSVGAAIEAHAAATRRAWIDAVAARQTLDYAQQVNAAAEASATLMARMARAGNASALDLAREQAFHADAAAGVLRASARQGAAREHLIRLLGLWGQDTAFTLPALLPALPAAALDLPDLEQRTLAARLDLASARQDAAALAASLGLTRATRLVNVLELGPVRSSESGMPDKRGYEIRLELPLFDWGSARSEHAEARYMQALQKVAASAVDARSQARERFLAYRAAWDLARHYRDEVIPLRQRIAQETLLRYNGMLVSSFALLADAREQAGAVHATIDALAQFWRAQADLEEAIGAPLAYPSTAAAQKESAP